MKIQQKNSRVEKEQKKEQPESVLEKTISVVFLIPFSKRYVYNEKREVNEMNYTYILPVSYTHLDVYKRQLYDSPMLLGFGLMEMILPVISGILMLWTAAHMKARIYLPIGVAEKEQPVNVGVRIENKSRIPVSRLEAKIKIQNRFYQPEDVYKRQEYTIDLYNFYPEVLKMNSDEPAAPGELGRLVVTDYYNKTFPMVRYDTGDTGIMRMYQDEKGRMHGKYVEIYGRRGSLMYNCMGEPLSLSLIHI